jgi:sialidase-1
MMSNTKRVKAEHGIICHMIGEKLGYFGWPSVARTDSGKLVAAASGLRYAHVDPWGKTVLFSSEDDGATWSEPFVLNDTSLDDRDAGVISLGGERLLVTWFTSDTKDITDVDDAPEDIREEWRSAIDAISDEDRPKLRGSWARVTEDGEAWGDEIQVPLNSPHGPVRLASGDLLYYGKQWWQPDSVESMESVGSIGAARSSDDGATWSIEGTVPMSDDVIAANLHEAHVVECASGKLVGMIRYEHRDGMGSYESFSLFQSDSLDGGKTWSEARYTGVYGSPPHVIRHSSGALVCVYGYRKDPYGQRVMISRDEGVTWDSNWIIRDDGPHGDLGYPASVELGDGRIMTVYYQNLDGSQKNCSLLYSVWEMPA